MQEDKIRIAAIRDIQQKYKVPKSLINHMIVQGHDVETTETHCKAYSETGHVECCNGCCWGDHPADVVEEKPKKKRQLKSDDA